MNLKNKPRWELLVPLCPCSHSTPFPVERPCQEETRSKAQGVPCTCTCTCRASFALGWAAETSQGCKGSSKQQPLLLINEQPKGRIPKRYWNTPIAISSSPVQEREELGAPAAVPGTTTARLGPGAVSPWCHPRGEARTTRPHDWKLELDRENLHKLWD